MTCPHRCLRVPCLRTAVAVAALASASLAISAQDMVRLTLPPFVSFAVTDVTRATAAVPAPVTIAFSNAQIAPDHVIVISVKADAAFDPEGGASIPVAKVSWTTAAAVHGTGVNGTLADDSYSPVFIGEPDQTTGSVDVTWTLAAPGGGIRAGAQDVTLRWKVESILP